MGANSTSIPSSDINETVLLVGQLMGLLNSEQAGQFSLNEDWFGDPLHYLKGIPSNPKLLELLETLLSSATGSAIGTPKTELNKTWYPILNPVKKETSSEAKPLGIYLVSSEPTKTAGTVIGFGLLHDFIPTTGITITPYGYFPVLQLPKDENDSFKFVLGQDGHPVQLGINIDGKGIFSSGDGINAISFDGINIGADIYFEEGKIPSLNLEFTNLKLPGETKGANRSIFDLIQNTSIEEWLTLVLSVLATQLSKVEGVGKTAAHIVNSLLELLGLLGNSPQPDWEMLKQTPSEAFLKWFRAIGGSSANLKAWMNNWFCLFKDQDPFTSKPDENVSGDGSQASPFAINILTFEVKTISIGIDFTMVATTDKEGTVSLLPGFRVASSSQSPLDGKDFGVRLLAEVMLLNFSLPTTNTANISFFPSFDLLVEAASNTRDKPLIATTVEGKAFSLGTIQLGFNFEHEKSSVPSPIFKITDVVAAEGSWPVIDMTSLNVETITQIIAPIVQAAVEKMFPEASGNQIVPNLAAVLGMSAPPEYAGTWPLADRMLLSAEGIQELINNPLTALGAYYERCLTSNDTNNQPLWQYLMPCFVKVLGGDGGTVSGTGTADNPWEVQIVSVGNAALNLQTWRATNDPKLLNLGFYFGLPIAMSQITANVGLATSMMQLTLPNEDGSGSFDASWFQSCAAQLKLTGPSGKPLVSPSLGGVSFQLDDFLFETGWNQVNHFFASAALENVKLNATGIDTIELGTLELDSLSWSQAQLTQFGPAITASLGLLMLEQGGRIGVGIATLLGLVPGLPKLFDGQQKQKDYPFAIPVGLTLPAIWPIFKLNHPTNPWADIETQLAKLLAGQGTNMEPAMQLLGWTFTGTLPKAPTNSPAGDVYDPWYVSLPDIWDIEVLTWLGANNQMGFGIRRPFSKTAFEKVQFESSIRLDVPGFMVDKSLLLNEDSQIPVAPRIWISANFANPDAGQPLLSEPTTGITIGSVNMGAMAEIVGGNFGYGLQFSFLDSRTASADPLGTIELTQLPNMPQYACEKGMQAIEALANALMVKLSSTALSADVSFAQLDAFLDILSLLEIFKKSSEQSTQYGINLGAWDTILANPGAYFITKGKSVLEDGEKNAAFFKDLATLLGYQDFKLPASAQGVQYLLQALGMLKPYPNNVYGLVMDTWVSLILHPIQFFQTSIPALFTNADVLKLLVTQLKSIAKPSSDIFSVDTSGYIVTLQTPTATPLKIGSEIVLFSKLQVNLKTLSMNLEVGAGAEIVDTAIAFRFSPVFTDGALSATYAFLLEGLPHGNLPDAFPPLPLYPFPENTADYLAQLGIQIPISILSSFTGSVLNSYVVPQYPTVLNIFKIMGLTRADETTSTEQIKPLAGIFMHPIQWVLSNDVLGDGNGHIDLGKLGSLLYEITDAAGIGSTIKLEPYNDNGKKDGVKLTGLPYGSSIFFSANNDTGASLQFDLKPTLPSPAPVIDLTAGISFGLSKGFDINGNIDLQFNLGDKGAESDTYIAVDSGYRAGAFHLDVQGQYKKTPFKTIKLVPFGGLAQFIPGTGDLINLLKFIGDKLFSAYNDYAAQHPSDNLIKFITDIENLTGIKDGDTLFKFFDDIKKDPLQNFKTGKVENTIAAICNFVTNILKLNGFTIAQSSKTLLQYQHLLPGSTGNSITILVGNQSFNGQTEVFGLWLQPNVTMKWFVLGLTNTGVGVSLSGATNLEYNVEIDLGIDLSGLPVAGLPSPTLALGFNGNSTTFNGPKIQLFPIKESTTNGTLVIDLLPSPGLAIIGQANTTVEQWLEKFAVKFLVPFVVDMALSVQQVNDFLTNMEIGKSGVTPGSILTGWGILGLNGKVYSLADLEDFYKKNNGAVGIVTKLIFTALDLLKGKTIISITKPKGQISVAFDEENNLYGLSVQMQDIVVTSGDNGKSPKLVFQLGKWYADQSKGDNWVNNTNDEPGMIFYFIQENKASNSVNFHPKVELLSVGLDFDGANEKTPLVNVKGFTLNAIQPRVYLSLDFGSGSPTIDFGVAIFMDGVGVPLGPGFDKKGGTSDNPVAQNLLSSGENSSGKTSAINPAFSFSTAYVSDAPSDKFKFILYDAQGNPTEKVWIPIMRAFGPLDCRKIGFGWISAAKLLQLMFDGSVTLAGLMVDLQDLEIGIPVTTPTKFEDYTLDLAGIDISFKGGPVTISGGFLKIGEGNSIQYVGAAVFQALSFTLGAFGGYGLVDDHPSLFVFAYLDTPLGGPPFFFITGLSGGFGYNRSVVLPKNTADVANYPMIAGIGDPSTLGGQDGKAPSGTQVLEKLGTEYFPPTLGEYWVAAGIKFTTYEIVSSNAVVILQFGREFEIDFIGTTGVILPKSGLTFVNAVLAFKVVFNPSKGVFMAEAVLTPNSWVIVPELKLTGGFAFYAWFKDQTDSDAKAGDFVLTIGGYFPGWPVPAWYPNMPRLGINWRFSDAINITGGAYFALTNSCIMAGGSLSIVFAAGGIKAWLTAYANFLVSWKPFYYEISIGVNVGASFWIFTIELGCDLDLWGPQMAGIVTVHWFIISFKIHFGDQDTPKGKIATISWDGNEGFTGYFLPKDQAPAPPPASDSNNRLVAASQPVLVQQVTKIIANDGLTKENTNADGTKDWIVRANQFAFELQTAVPLNQITFASSEGNPKDPITNLTPFGIKPVGTVTFAPAQPNKDPEDKVSTMEISFLYNGEKANVHEWDWADTESIGSVSESLWGTVNTGKESAGNKVISKVLQGVKLVKPTVKVPFGGLPTLYMDLLDRMNIATRNLPLVSRPQLRPSAPVKVDDNTLAILAATIMDTQSGIMQFRNDIIDCIVGLGISVNFDGRLDQLAAFAETTFQAPPLLGELGSIGEMAAPNEAITTFRMAALTMATEKTTSSPKPMSIRAIIHQFATADAPSSKLFPLKAFYGSPVKKSAATVHRRSHSGSNRLGKALMKSLAAKTKADSCGIEVRPGSTYLLDVPAGNEQPRIRLPKGKLPVRIAVFDHHQQLLEEKILGNGEYVCPEGTGQIVLSGLLKRKKQELEAIGWHEHSSLVLVNPNALLGESVIVVPHNPIRIKNKKFNVGEGVVSGAELVARSWASCGAGNIVRAEIKTIFPTYVNTIAVLVRSENEKSKSPKVSLRLPIYKGSKKSGWAFHPIAPVARMKRGKDIVFLFNVPSNHVSGDITAVSVASEGWYQTGVMGFREAVEAVHGKWNAVSIKHSQPICFDEMKESTTVEIMGQFSQNSLKQPDEELIPS